MANYKSAISFGLVHIPVILNTAVRNNDTSFNQIHKKCMERINYIKYCPHCKKEVNNKDIVKGYEYSKDEYITFDKEEFDKLKGEIKDNISKEIIDTTNKNPAILPIVIDACVKEYKYEKTKKL